MTGTGRQTASRHWSILGALLGVLLALLLFAPASWLARALASSTNDHVLLTETRGTIWSGSGALVLSGGAGSHDAAALPGRLQWTLRPQGLGLLLSARQDGILNGLVQLRLTPGLSRMGIELVEHQDWLARLPASVLAGLGTPWNTLQFDGTMRISAQGLKLEQTEGRWQQSGQLNLDLVDLSSRVSTLQPLGSYRFSVLGNPSTPGVSEMHLITLEGALLLSGQGTVSAGSARFMGEARAAPGREAALDNLLNIIGRRDGARSVISIG